MARTSIQYMLSQEALKGEKNNNTIKAYKADIKKFANFCRENGINNPEFVINNKLEILQNYERLLEKKYSPQTIHRKLAAPCKGLGVCMSEINKPRRTAGSIKRGRKSHLNPQGKMEINNPKYERLLDFQSRVGLRRNELCRLTGKDLIRDENGYLCVRVMSGKGGKMQLQRILPDDISRIESFFEKINPDQNIFSKEEMNNKINLHGLRAQHARDAYKYYLNKLLNEPDYRTKALGELRDRYGVYHRGNINAASKWLYKCVNNTPYVLRGDNRKKALEQGLPVQYNRLALMLVSVFHLSHWRLDVTVTNYII